MRGSQTAAPGLRREGASCRLVILPLRQADNQGPREPGSGPTGVCTPHPRLLAGHGSYGVHLLILGVLGVPCLEDTLARLFSRGHLAYRKRRLRLASRALRPRLTAPRLIPKITSTS